MMKTAAYIALHYGSDYLKYAIESVREDIDHFFFLYTPTPSHGSNGSKSCPDTEESLLNIVKQTLGEDKFTWIKGSWTQENQQRNYAHEIAKQKGYDMLVALDFDEIWREGYLAELLKLTYERKVNKCLVWMRHLWRSFNYICDDPMRQERIYYLKATDKNSLIYAPQPENQIYHFGYARKPSDMEYKIGIHGHSAEWLQSKQAWFSDKFMAWPPVNEKGESLQYVHPVCEGVWHPQKFDKNLLPSFMKEHPYYNLEVI